MFQNNLEQEVRNETEIPQERYISPEKDNKLLMNKISIITL